MEALQAFLSYLLENAWWFLTNVVLVREPMLALLPLKYQQSIRKHWLLRQLVKYPNSGLARYCLAVSGILVVSFLAFQSEYNKVLPHIVFKIGNTKAFLPKVITGDIYAKVLVRYEGAGSAVCGVFLNELEKEGDKEPILIDQDFMLGAENGGEPGLKDAFTFSNGSEHYFNVAWIAKGDNKMSIQSKEYNDTFPEPLLAGTYKFTIKTQGANCPSAYSEVWISYNGGEHIKFLLDRPKQR